MAVNLAEKYSAKVDERITIGAYTGKNLNTDYEFTGVQTVKIYSIGTVGLNDYVRAGLSRYGIPEELQDSVQELTVKQDKAFTFTIDKGNDKQQLNIKGAAKALKRQIDEVVIPFIDKYRFAIMVAESNKVVDDGALTKTNIYEKILDSKSYLSEKGIDSGLVTYMTPKAFNLLKLDSSFVKSGDLSQKMLIKGQVGEVDGDAIIVVGGNRMPAGVDFITTQNKVMVSPMVLRDYKIHVDPPGIDGNLVEGRILFDAFLLGNKKDGLYVYGNRESALKFTNATGYKTVVSGVDVYTDETVYNKVASAEITPVTIGKEFSAAGYTKMNKLSDEITGTSTNKYAEVVIVDRNGKVRDAAAQTLTA